MSNTVPNVQEGKSGRKLLILIRLRDGDLILQDTHQPRRHYNTEAKTLLRRIFSKKPGKFCARSEAEEAFSTVLNFHRPSDTSVGACFVAGGIEYHPVMVDLAYIGLVKSWIMTRADEVGCLEDHIIEDVFGHPFEATLQQIFPRPEETAK